MTWNPLKKVHLTTKLTFAPAVISRADDQELEVVYHKLQYLEEATRKLQKNMKKYLEQIGNAVKAELKITADLSNSQSCFQDDKLRKLVEEYHTINSKAVESAGHLSQVSQQAFQDPLKKYAAFFIGIEAAFQRREQLVQEWRNLSTKVRKIEMRERTASNVMKMERERQQLATACNDLVAYHTSLLLDLKQFLSKRIEYFEPILQALLSSQLDYHGCLTQLFTFLVQNPNPSLSCSPSSACIPDQQFQANIEDKLSKIKALSIVKPSRSSANQAK